MPTRPWSLMRVSSTRSGYKAQGQSTKHKKASKQGVVRSRNFGEGQARCPATLAGPAKKSQKWQYAFLATLVSWSIMQESTKCKIMGGGEGRGA